MDDPCYIIAEIGVNHNGSFDLACELIDAAVACKADAVKFQTFRATDLVTASAAKAAYQSANTENNDSQFAMLKALELSEDTFAKLNAYCQQRGIAFLSTPFSEDAVDVLARIGVNAYKVSSGDLTHLDLLSYMAKQGRPIILSTGMGTIGEVEEALNAIQSAGDVDVSLLHCVSNYPAAPEDCNLAAMDTMAQAFGLPVGWSDHTLGPEISWAAVARGAKVIEKHITLDQTLPGPDHKASMEPDDFAEFVAGIRRIEAAIGTGRKGPTEAEKQTALVGRRSITAVHDLPKGTVLTAADLKVVRPGTGLAPRMMDFVIGSVLTRDVAADTPIVAGDIHA
ncbi:N-acetylneuraminate synthase [Halocynthiibacter styelae]|uniref:N-acetylneuraminate synthase n=1 Tax=Halocynthiibacter styelae TaxID=2761955 RepID=A0A8J7IYT1_9RHOB|nr:N-acetylneuraminate synthase [Paenihalocynthiibacter styelae]MBI1494719.1 N-acetylneuraminate synthase [Paenihalocynthiibacter styelae]